MAKPFTPLPPSLKAVGVDLALGYAHERTHLLQLTTESRETICSEEPQNLDEWDDAVVGIERRIRAT